MTKISNLQIGDSFYHNDMLLKITGSMFTTNTRNSYLPVEHDGRRYEFRCTPDMKVQAA